MTKPNPLDFRDAAEKLAEAVVADRNQVRPETFSEREFPQSDKITPEIEEQNWQDLERLAKTGDRVSGYFGRFGGNPASRFSVLDAMESTDPNVIRVRHADAGSTLDVEEVPTPVVPEAEGAQGRRHFGEATDEEAEQMFGYWAKSAPEVPDIAERLATGASLGDLTLQQRARYSKEIAEATDVLIHGSVTAARLANQEAGGTQFFELPEECIDEEGNLRAPEPPAFVEPIPETIAIATPTQVVVDPVFRTRELKAALNPKTEPAFLTELVPDTLQLDTFPVDTSVPGVMHLTVPAPRTVYDHVQEPEQQSTTPAPGTDGQIILLKRALRELIDYVERTIPRSVPVPDDFEAWKAMAKQHRL